MNGMHCRLCRNPVVGNKKAATRSGGGFSNAGRRGPDRAVKKGEWWAQQDSNL